METLNDLRRGNEQREGFTPTLEKGLQDGHVNVLVLLGANVKHGDLIPKRMEKERELINPDVPQQLARCSESPPCVKH